MSINMDKFAIRIHTDEFRFRCARGIHEHTGKEFHLHHEIFFLLDGEAELFSELGKIKLAPGTLVIVPKENLHQFFYIGNERDYFRCTFSFGSIEEFSELISSRMQKITVFQTDSLSELSFLFEKAKTLTFSARSIEEKRILLKAYLIEILVHLDITSEMTQDTAFLLSPITQKAIAYINQNIAADLSLASLSEYLHISESHLSHVFKADIHLPIHKYVQQKRLLLANDKILNSVPSVVAAAECGYHDYSNFYLQYKKYFGTAPSQSTKN